MSDLRLTASPPLIAALLFVSAAAAFYFLRPVDLPGADRSERPPGQSLNSGPSPGVLEQTAVTAPGAKADEISAAARTASGTSGNPAPAGNDESRRYRETRRAARLDAYNQIPAEDRARRLSERLGLTDEQEQQLAAIMAHSSAQMAALDDAALSETEQANAVRQIQSEQRQKIAPIVLESPALQGSMQKFMEAGYARGGTVVGPRSGAAK